jgi:hypothetical protein
MQHFFSITAKAYLAEYRLHTAVRFGESPAPRAQRYDDQTSSLIGDDTGWPTAFVGAFRRTNPARATPAIADSIQ